MGSRLPSARLGRCRAPKRFRTSAAGARFSPESRALNRPGSRTPANEGGRSQAAERAQHETRRANRRLAESVYLGIKQNIFEFRLLPGDRFTENEIAGRLHVSRTPVREALFGWSARATFTSISQRLEVRDLDFKQFDDLYDLRIALETAAYDTFAIAGRGANLDELKSVWLGAAANAGCAMVNRCARWTRPFTARWSPPQAIARWSAAIRR